MFEDGECFLPGERFLNVLKSYKGKKNLTLEIDYKGSASARSPPASVPIVNDSKQRK